MILSNGPTLPRTVESFLFQKNIEFDVVEHPHTESALTSAIEASIDGSSMIKGVVLLDLLTNKYYLALLPANQNIDLDYINRHFHKMMRLATEDELNHIFDDCDYGAVPGVGQAYNLQVIWDDHLAKLNNLYMESGNHHALIHLGKSQFGRLYAGSHHGELCQDKSYDSIQNLFEAVRLQRQKEPE